MVNLVELIGVIAQNANKESMPCDWMYGTVETVEPLSIRINAYTLISEQFLVLSHLVKEHFVDMTVSMQTENDAFMVPEHTHVGNLGKPTDTGTLDTTHKHEIKHKIKVLQHYGLKVGEKVVLLQRSGGKTYYVIDRVEPPICEGEWL